MAAAYKAVPQILIPGQKMNFWVNHPGDRVDFIAHLKTLSEPANQAPNPFHKIG